jgi:hypothetical protein
MMRNYLRVKQNFEKFYAGKVMATAFDRKIFAMRLQKVPPDSIRLRPTGLVARSLATQIRFDRQ